jgi:hypothetical protein
METAKSRGFTPNSTNVHQEAPSIFFRSSIWSATSGDANERLWSPWSVANDALGIKKGGMAMVKRAPARRRPRKAKPSTKGLGPAECRLQEPAGRCGRGRTSRGKSRRLRRRLL